MLPMPAPLSAATESLLELKLATITAQWMETDAPRPVLFNLPISAAEDRASATRAPYTAIRAPTTFPARLATLSQLGTRPTTAALRPVPPFRTAVPVTSPTTTPPTHRSCVRAANSASQL